MKTPKQNPEPALGGPPDSYCDSYYGQRPAWLQGYIGHFDARFLFKAALAARVDVVVEIGTASGFSTGLLCYAQDLASKAGLIGPDYKVISYDIDPMFYANRTIRTGEGAREQLPKRLLDHIVFRNPAVATDARQEFAEEEVEFLFIDANHEHPWPTLDLIAMLDCLAPGATVVLHDINLPVLIPTNSGWGPKYLFDELDIEKSVPDDGELPNIGSIRIPRSKKALRKQLLGILFAHDWCGGIPAEFLERLGIERKLP